MEWLQEIAKESGPWAVMLIGLVVVIYKLSMKWSDRLLNEDNGIVTGIAKKHFETVDTLVDVQRQISNACDMQTEELRSLRDGQTGVIHHLKENSDRMARMCQEVHDLSDLHEDVNSPFATARIVKSIPDALAIVEKFAETHGIDVKREIDSIRDHIKGGI